MISIAEFADKYNMLPDGTSVICAVSGGADSVCLLYLMIELAKKRNLSIYAAHFNHRLRGEEADRDEEFVRKLCEKENIKLFTGSADVREYAHSCGIGTEEAARKLRYAFFESVAEKIPHSRVATAHNAEDNAETVLMNISRGTGLNGLCGIPPVREIYIRPMLFLSRDEITAFLRENNISNIEDSTNSENLYTRNRIRHNVITELKAINPDFAGMAFQAAELLREDERLLSELSAAAVPIVRISENRLELSASKLTSNPFSLASRSIRTAAEMLGAKAGQSHVNACLRLASADNPSGKTFLPGEITVFREYDVLVFTYANNNNKTFSPKLLNRGEWTDIDELGLSVYIGDIIETGKRTEKYYFRKKDLCGDVFIRPRRTGDKICLDKRAGTKTLKKLFIEKKIPLEKRELIPVIADDKNVLAVLSMGYNKLLSANAENDCMLAVLYK